MVETEMSSKALFDQETLELVLIASIWIRYNFSVWTSKGDLRPQRGTMENNAFYKFNTHLTYCEIVS